MTTSVSAARDCWICKAPITGMPHTFEDLTGRDQAWPEDLLRGGPAWAHRVCCDAWIAGDRAMLKALRLAACAEGHHQFPGRWTTDPADPHGDASFWDCEKGCGHRQTHPGYGIGKAIAEMSGVLFETAGGRK